MHTSAVVFEAPEQLALQRLALTDPGPMDVVVDVEWTGISTGTERLLLTGRMPPFPGLGYPLVPGYEAVGRVSWAGPEAGRTVGQRVFVPGTRGFKDVRGLFGAAAGRLVVAGSRALPLKEEIGSDGVLIALAATAYHAGWQPGVTAPDLIIGHGALGRLLARLATELGEGPAPVVWEVNPARRGGAEGYRVVAPEEDPQAAYRAIYDVSGDARLLDRLIGRLAPGGEVVMAGFYHEPLRFDFVPAFLKEARLRVAAEWKPDDLQRTVALVNAGRLRLDGIVSHCRDAATAPAAYAQAFSDPECVKMILDWREAA